ncbi:MAG: transporter substrate-binding protein [Paenibacillaceae bacterium]|nr:transporter substrate-binding protein [Paenibacillaceae bacterium]
MRKKWLPVVLSLAMVVPAITACTSGNSEDNNEERVLRVAVSSDYGDDGEYFRQQFTEIYEYANPKVKIEIVPVVDSSMYRYGGYINNKEGAETPDPIVKLKEIMQGENPPDVVMVNLNELQELITENLLQPLDPLISTDKFDIADIVPAVTEGLKSASPDGKLYALSPTFSSSALVYNRKIFDDAGVAYPQDNMTWDQIFDLARRVAKTEGEKRIYGFSFSSQGYPDFMTANTYYASPLGLTTFTEEVDKLTVDSDQWEKVWTTLIQLEKDKILPSQLDYNDQAFMQSKQSSEDNPFGYDDFMSGRLAMGIMNYGELSRIDNANKNAANYKNFIPIEYNAVTMPSHAEKPGAVAGIGLNGIMGINAKAGNSKDAWSFLKFINGQDWARSKAKSNYQLLSRKSYIKTREGSDLNMDAFLNVKPIVDSSNDFYKVYRKYPNIYMVQSLGQQEYMQALQGNKSIRDALKSWQTQGDSMLQQMKDDPNGNIQMGVSSAVRAY